MNGVPDEVRALVGRRERARSAEDFASADALRERIRRAGFDVTDTPKGPVLTPQGGDDVASPTWPVYASSAQVESCLGDPPRFDASVQWVVEGWPEDVLRGIKSFAMSASQRSLHHVVVDLTQAKVDWPRGAEVLHLAPDVGWAAARNAGLRRSAGRVVILADGSVEPTGDVVEPLQAALEDPTVGIAGPFGLVTDDLHEFQSSEGPEVDAIEGYVMALRRELVEGGLRFDERFKFYRNADIELSFQIKAMGLRAIVTPTEVIRHEHRMWTNTSEADRQRLSKRNFYRFLDKWRGRTDLLVGRRNR